MKDKLKELEEKVNVLADKLREQYEINLNLIELIKTIGNSEFHVFRPDNERLNNSINKLNEMNSKFSNPLRGD